MRSALLCVFVTLFVEGDIVAGDDFRPTPIPLDEWRPGERRGRAGTLHETIQTASPPTTVVIPAHYWEDALRHSVYLTLVRDKIDQLIAKDDISASDNKENNHELRNIDDQDLWEKIKAAPFDRLKEDESTTYGDVTILARGRLLEESKGYRFREDDKSHEKCDNDKCMDGVKAFWSVKRVRQRDQEMSPGKYHYELTFSVMSQIPKKQSKPYERPIRTFTVQESTNDRVTDKPLSYHRTETVPPQISRPERAIWFHKNIAQTPRYHKRQQQSELDRLFSSLFDDDDDDEDENYEQQRRYKQNQYQPTYSPYSKVGYVGSASSEHNTHLKSLPYPYKHHVIKNQNHPPTDPFHQHYLEEDSGLNYPHLSQTDYKPQGYNKVDSTTRPAVLPTPLPPLASSKDSYMKKSTTTKYEWSDNVTNPPAVHKQYNKGKAPVKVNYFPERLRPPIYNAPPGVFVTMDKKPFKPMPPLKMPTTKPMRSHKPIDFRPSPQVLDVQFSEPDPLFDSAFRPITVNYADSTNSTEKTLVSEENKYSENILHKPNVSTKKPPKKHNNTKSHGITTQSPDIITAHSVEQDDIMEWADMLGIFAKTTPMDIHKEKNKTISTTTPLPTTSAIIKLDTTETTTETPSSSTTMASSTQKTKKRTRPPLKFNKTEKIKKHKRITTTTPTSTTTSTSSPLTTKLIKENKRVTPDSDIKQQTSTTVISTTKTPWKPSSKATTTPLSTISTSTTENPPSTTTIKTTSKPSSTESTTTARSKNINRFRQSTLLIKGTSLKHDRWSATSATPEKIRSVSSNYNHRRKGSNFQGYLSSTPKYVDEERNRHDHIDGTSTIRPITTNQEITTKKAEVTSTVPPDEESEGDISMDGEEISKIKEENKETSEESRDQSEYIFQSTEPANDESNEIIDTEATFTTEKIVITSQSTPKGKKCKKKHQNSTTEAISTTTTTTIAPTTTTTTTTTPSILEDLLNDFSFDDIESENNERNVHHDTDKEASQSHEHYFNMNDDIKELLDTINKNSKYEGFTDDDEYDEENDDEDGDDDDDDEREALFEEEDISYHSSDDSPRHSNDEYDEKPPLTLLELMAME
ncbi:flocculation protein FLO11 [Papilio machaon]|uniref:flocculation protein FLO11 n=1 Tax=Papilio machaon TaxID=76193 RepID=UPI001E66331A|nr:flocculation protein FLO11 [Papilio machaon]